MSHLPDGTPVELAEWGRKIADHDPRSGVGLRDDGLPEIVWGETVPPGTYAYQTISHTMNYPYKLARYPLTVIQFQVFLDSDSDAVDGQWWADLPDSSGKDSISASHMPYANHPRDSVSFYQSIAFTRWLTSEFHAKSLLEDDWEIRLPEDFEWEIAARYPDGRRYPWGDDYRVGHANVDEQTSGVGPYTIGTSTAVGLYESGRHPLLNLYDLTGNVSEWCYRNFPDEVKEKDGKIRGRGRGGSFYDDPILARSTTRDHYEVNPRVESFGLRLCAAPYPASHG